MGFNLIVVDFQKIQKDQILMMQTSNSSDAIINGDPAWCIIAEYTLSEVAAGVDTRFGQLLGSLYKTLRDLGVQPGYLNKLEETINSIAAGARGHLPGVGPGVPVVIRLLCQRISIDSLSRLEKYRDGGWGYYLIEREQDFPDIASQERHRVVELYLYKEGM